MPKIEYKVKQVLWCCILIFIFYFFFIVYLEQVAQSPNRNEPNAAGEVNFKYVFEVLENLGYNDWVGCEYKPTTNSKENLEWIRDYGYSFWV